MARPSKAADALSCHATKADLTRRKAAETAMLTGKPLSEQPEVAADPAAHAEFERVKMLLAAIGKDDALYGSVINRYCLLRSECAELKRMKARFEENLDELENDTELDASVRYKLQAQMQKSILDADNRVQAKRKMMFDIEKECAMTVASALRSVPKAPSSPQNPLIGLINSG